jgi:hypothetical protein
MIGWPGESLPSTALTASAWTSSYLPSPGDWEEECTARAAVSEPTPPSNAQSKAIIKSGLGDGQFAPKVWCRGGGIGVG